MTCRQSSCHPLRPQAGFWRLKRWFQDPDRPIASCTLPSCSECSLATRINCHFNFVQLARFYLIILPLFGLGGYLLYSFTPAALWGWIGYMVLYFGLIEIRVMCSHCPHYGETSGRTLTCWANYGAPKLWRYRPGPMSLWEKGIFLGGLATVFLVPAIAGAITENYLLMTLYTVLVILWKWLLKRNYCTQCFNFACPLNRTDITLRKQFLSQNPSLQSAWERD